MSKVFELISLDVWGNANDGFTVNQAFYTGQTIEVQDIDNDTDIINALIEATYLTDNANMETITVTGDGDYMLYIDATKSGEPLWQMRPIAV